PIDDDELAEPWLLPPSRRSEPRPIIGTLPISVNVTLADGIFVDRTDLPPEMVARLVRLAAFQKPEFYRAQAMRLPTYGKPRIVFCAEDHPKHFALPRGCLDDVMETIGALKIKPVLRNERHIGAPLKVTFQGTLRPDQQAAVEALLAH